MHLNLRNSVGLKKVFVRVGQPVRSPEAQEGDPWWCRIEIDGLGHKRLMPIAGVDSLRSLLLALQFAKKCCQNLPKKKMVSFTGYQSGAGEIIQVLRQWPLRFIKQRCFDCSRNRGRTGPGSVISGSQSEIT